MQRRYEPSSQPAGTSAAGADPTGSRPVAVALARSPASVDQCDLCGGATIDIKCKLICQNCGFTRDCSDP